MIIYPAIDIYDAKAVRLYKGDYAEMTVYSEEPLRVARYFRACGADHIHLVDIEGAREGRSVNIDIISAIAGESGLFSEVGGGIRDMETIERYIAEGVDRVILGTKAVTDREFLTAAIERFGGRIAVGVDIRDGRVSVSGWTLDSGIEAFSFCEELEALGVSTIISTDISRDGAMRGTNIGLYERLSEELSLDIIASGGVSSLDDVRRLASLGIHGAIIGKALYTGDIALRDAIAAAAPKTQRDAIAAAAPETQRDAIAAAAPKTQRDAIAAAAPGTQRDAIAAAAPKTQRDAIAAAAPKPKEA